MDAYFNLPFGVRIADEKPVDGDRYLATNIVARDALIGSGREFNGLQVYVEDEQKLYILKDKIFPVWEELGLANTELYNGASPTNVTVGGIPAGTDLTGQSWIDIVQSMTVAYLTPEFTSFLITGQSTLLEVGDILSGIKDFTWTISNPTNIVANSIDIDDFTNNVNLASSIANSGSVSLDIGTISNIVPISQVYRISAEDVLSDQKISNYTINSIYPYFYGKVASGGAASGINRPVADQSLIDSGTKVISNSTGTITVSYASTSDDYLWFAIPTTSASKNAWYINALNNGAIGGSVSPGGNLFPVFDSVSIDSPTILWNGITYKIYISNFQSAVSDPIQLRNS